MFESTISMLLQHGHTHMLQIVIIIITIIIIKVGCATSHFFFPLGTQLLVILSYCITKLYYTKVMVLTSSWSDSHEAKPIMPRSVGHLMIKDDFPLLFSSVYMSTHLCFCLLTEGGQMSQIFFIICCDIKTWNVFCLIRCMHLCLNNIFGFLLLFFLHIFCIMT